MAALPHPVLPVGSLPAETPRAHYRHARTLWLALRLLDPPPEAIALESLADFAQSLTPVVVLKPGEGLLLEVKGSLKYFSGLRAIKERLLRELERRAWVGRLATAPTPLAAAWLVRCKSIDIVDESLLAGAVGDLPLTATAWPQDVQRMLEQMGLSSIADCLRLPRAGFARRIGKDRLGDLDRALGRTPDFQDAYQAPQTLGQAVEFTLETMDRALFAEALSGIVAAFESELRRRQMQIDEIELEFEHLQLEATRTRIRFVDPVHERERILNPLLARIERLTLPGPAIGLALKTGGLLPFKAATPELLPLTNAKAATAVSENALVECLRGRFGARSVYGIDWVTEHRPEHAWRRRIDDAVARAQPASPRHGRPLWLLPQQKKWGQTPFRKERGLTPFDMTPFDSKQAGYKCSRKGSDPNSSNSYERIESGWWDGRDVRRDYHVVIGAAGQKLWLYRDCRTQEWYLHGIFG